LYCVHKLMKDESSKNLELLYRDMKY